MGGNGLRVAVDYDTPHPDETFNLRVHEAKGDARESFTGLSMDAGHGRYAETVIKAGSRLVRVKEDLLTVVSAAQRLCQERRIFLLLDALSTWGSVDTARAGLSAFDAVRGNHAGLYFPHLQLTDQLTGRLRSFPQSGAVAGVIARTDSERGVWKAPAGTEAQLAGVHTR